MPTLEQKELFNERNEYVIGNVIFSHRTGDKVGWICPVCSARLPIDWKLCPGTMDLKRLY